MPLHVAIQLYFTGKNGEPCGSRKSDIWAGCVAMMNALVGKDDCDEANKKVHTNIAKCLFYICTQFALYFNKITVSGNRYKGYISAAHEKVNKV